MTLRDTGSQKKDSGRVPVGTGLVGCKCRGNALSLGAYFLEAKRVSVQCRRPPKHRVFVNPPLPDNDGTVLLCDFCNRFDYIGFRREPLTDAAKARGE